MSEGSILPLYQKRKSSSIWSFEDFYFYVLRDYTSSKYYPELYSEKERKDLEKYIKLPITQKEKYSLFPPKKYFLNDLQISPPMEETYLGNIVSNPGVINLSEEKEEKKENNFLFEVYLPLLYTRNPKYLRKGFFEIWENRGDTISLLYFPPKERFLPSTIAEKKEDLELLSKYIDLNTLEEIRETYEYPHMFNDYFLYR